MPSRGATKDWQYLLFFDLNVNYLLAYIVVCLPVSGRYQYVDR